MLCYLMYIIYTIYFFTSQHSNKPCKFNIKSYHQQLFYVAHRKVCNSTDSMLRSNIWDGLILTKTKAPNETYLSQPITLCKLVKWLCGSYAIHSSLVERLVHYLTRVCLSWGRLLTEAGAQSVEYCSHLVRHCRRGSWRQTAAGTNTSQSPVQVSECVCVWGGGVKIIQLHTCHAMYVHLLWF